MVSVQIYDVGFDRFVLDNFSDVRDVGSEHNFRDDDVRDVDDFTLKQIDTICTDVDLTDVDNFLTILWTISTVGSENCNLEAF